MMTPATCLEELHRRKYERPFHPFEILTVEGSRYQIGDRMKFAATPRTVIVLDSVDRSHRFSVSKVKSIQTILKSVH